MLPESLLIGETVIYFNGFKDEKGVIIGTEIIKHTQYDVFPTTGYCILNEAKQLKHVPYHRVIGIVEPDIVFLELLVKEGDMVQINFPKYQKPEHPRGWQVDNESNNDLPL